MTVEGNVRRLIDIATLRATEAQEEGKHLEGTINRAILDSLHQALPDQGWEYPTPTVRVREAQDDDTPILLVEVLVSSLVGVYPHPTTGSWWRVAADLDTWVPILETASGSPITDALHEFVRAWWERRDWAPKPTVDEEVFP